MTPYYLRRPRIWREPLPLLDDRTVVSARWSYVFARVPKAANSTVLRSLLTSYPEPDSPDLTDPARFGRFRDSLPRLSDLAASDLGALAGCFHFTFVRNPFSRTLSAFLNKIGEAERAQTREQARYRKNFGQEIMRCGDGRLTFLGFCRFLAEGGERRDAHWCQQVRFCRLLDRMHAVGRVETLADDLARILPKIGGRGLAAPVSSARHKTDAANRAEELYGTEAKTIVQHLYAGDFETFGYDASGPELG